MRHLVKRAVVNYIQKQDLLKKPLDGCYYKLFVMLNKNALPQRQKQIENADRKHIISFVQSEFVTSRNVLLKKLPK